MRELRSEYQVFFFSLQLHEPKSSHAQNGNKKEKKRRGDDMMEECSHTHEIPGSIFRTSFLKKKKNNLYLTKLLFKSTGNIDSPRKAKSSMYLTTRPALQDMFKGVLQSERRGQPGSNSGGQRRKPQTERRNDDLCKGRHPGGYRGVTAMTVCDANVYFLRGLRDSNLVSKERNC